MVGVGGFPTRIDAGEALDEGECRDLLATRAFGVVGTTRGALPLIVPVSYVYRGDEITFRVRPGSLLAATETGDVLAFETDVYDNGAGVGWSVLVVGRASVAADEMSTSGPDGTMVRLSCELVTGRRLGADLRGRSVR